MELREYFNLIKKNRKMMAGAVLLVMLFTFLFSLFKPVYFETSVTYLVNRAGSEPTPDYQYDGYYSIKASDLMAETVEQWLKNPEVVKSIYDSAKVEENFTSLKDMTQKFKVTKLTSQLIEVRFKTKDAVDAKRVAGAAAGAIRNKTALLNNKDGKGGEFVVIDSAPVVVEVRQDIILNLSIALVSGLLLGFFLAAGKEYWR